MPPATLRKKIGALESEKDSLSSELEKMQTEHNEELDKLKERLKKSQEKEQDQKKDVNNAADKRVEDRHEKKAEIDDMQDDLEGVTRELEEHRAMLKELQSELNLRMMDMEMCGCPEKESFLSIKSHQPPDNELVFKFEELEREKNDLSNEIDKELASYGSEQRNLLHRLDIEKGKMDRREIREDKYKKEDEGAMKSVKQQHKAMEEYLKSKKDQLERVEKEVEEAQEHYDKLEKEMGKCGCGPKGL